MSGVPKFHHIALSVRDLEESVAWYETMFGLKVINRMFFDAVQMSIAFVGNEDFVIELLSVPNAKPLPEGRNHPDTDNATLGVKHFCIQVENNKEFIAEMVRKGAKIVFETQPGGDESYAAFVNVPTGNVIEIFDDRNHVADKL